jgi:ELWxxDGT repeat protein
MKFLRLVPVCLLLLPAAAAAQGSIGPLQRSFSNGFVISSARAGSLAFFTTLFPSSNPGQFGSDFLRTDGTPGGTFSIDPRGSAGPQGRPQIRFADSLGGLLFFTGAKSSTPEDRGLWRSDGTVAGTFPVTQGLSLALDSGGTEPPVTRPIPERGLMFFSASPRPGTPDFELWATDGTPEGTRLVKDVNPEGSSNPRRMTAFGGRLFFFADTPQGRELWRSDGTPNGTERVHDFPAGSEILSVVQAGGALFVLQNTASGLEVWRSDGTGAGTEPVLNLPRRPYNHQATGRHLFLVVQDELLNKEMWAVGGTGGAVRIPQVETAQEIQLFAAGDHLAFSLEDDHGREPWWSDGTPEGTRRAADICPGPCGSSPAFVATYGQRAVLLANDGVSGVEPWLTDGTAAGTWRLGDLCPGECGGGAEVQEVNGWLVLRSDRVIRVSDGTPDGAWIVGNTELPAERFPFSLPNHALFLTSFQFPQVPLQAFLWSLPVTAPAPPPGPWLETAQLPGFRFKVQIDGRIVGRQEPACLARTLCVSGALPGRSEVFLRVAGPKPNGRLWPSLIKLTPSAADVWIVQTATGLLRHYRLEGSGPGSSALPGLLDREGFLPAPSGTEQLLVEGVESAKAVDSDPQPPDRWIESAEVPGFRIQARLTSAGQSRILRKELCIAETFCLSGALPGVTELLVRVPGPRPNGYYWPTLARFTPAALEVWVQQRTTGQVRYYRLDPQPVGSDRLDGYVDKQGFKR